MTVVLCAPTCQVDRKLAVLAAFHADLNHKPFRRAMAKKKLQHLLPGHIQATTSFYNM